MLHSRETTELVPEKVNSLLYTNQTDLLRRLTGPKYTSQIAFHLPWQLTLKVLVSTIDAQWEGMGDVGSARYEPALLPPCPTTRVLSYSN